MHNTWVMSARALLFAFVAIHSSQALQAQSAATSSKVLDAQVNEAKIRQTLDSVTKIHFLETPLLESLEFLEDKHKIEIVVDRKALDEAGIETSPAITLELKNISLRAALIQMLRPLDLTFIVIDEVLLITIPEVA